MPKVTLDLFPFSLQLEEGAVSNVFSSDGKLVYTTIGKNPAQKICGMDIFSTILLPGSYVRVTFRSTTVTTTVFEISADGNDDLVMKGLGRNKLKITP